MASQIKIYKDNPTAGETNGTLVSSGTNTDPIESGSLKANENEVGASIKLATRCDSGFQTEGDTVISIIDSESVDKWSLAPDSGGSPGTWGGWGASLTISSTVGATNTIFWARARALDTEDPANDTSVQIRVAATIAAEM